MTVLSTHSPQKCTPEKLGLKRKLSSLSSPTFSGQKRSRQAESEYAHVPLRRPKKPVGEAWALSDLRAFDAPLDVNCGPILRDLLRSRGWTFNTACHGMHDKNTDTSTMFVKEFEACLRGQTPEKLFGKKGSVEDGYRLQAIALPKRALWMMGRMPFRVPGTLSEQTREREDFIKIVCDHGADLPGPSGNYRIGRFPKTETLMFKTNLTEAFRDKPWYPLTYCLPKEKTAFLEDVRARGQSKNNLWIGKPRNDYGGTGIRVWKGTDKSLAKVVEESDTAKRQVLQQYLADPLLIGGYKFHMRIHLVVTNVCPLEAYVQENGQCLFATKPYTVSDKNLGDNFDPPVHVTNMGLNSKPANKENFFRKKPIVGRGQQIRVNQLVSHLAANTPNFDKTALWKQILNISTDAAIYIANGVKKQTPRHKLVPDRHFEIFGMDLMLDKNMKVWMCEVNTDPGLSYPDKEVLGSPNPDYQKELSACVETFHDMFALLGLDAKREQAQGSLKHWFELDFADYNGRTRSRSNSNEPERKP